MRKTLIKWLARGAFAALVAGAMLVAGPQYAVANDCPEPNAGYCPPLDDQSCNEACLNLQYEGGVCVGPCCTCWM
jgi:hypothetical protein